jgi:hypothetical protein
MKLTDAAIKKLAVLPGKTEASLRDSDVPGLTCRIRLGGKPAWYSVIATARSSAKSR